MSIPLLALCLLFAVFPGEIFFFNAALPDVFHSYFYSKLVNALMGIVEDEFCNVLMESQS